MKAIKALITFLLSDTGKDIFFFRLPTLFSIANKYNLSSMIRNQIKRLAFRLIL